MELVNVLSFLVAETHYLFNKYLERAFILKLGSISPTVKEWGKR